MRPSLSSLFLILFLPNFFCSFSLVFSVLSSLFLFYFFCSFFLISSSLSSLFLLFFLPCFFSSFFLVFFLFSPYFFSYFFLISSVISSLFLLLFLLYYFFFSPLFLFLFFLISCVLSSLFLLFIFPYFFCSFFPIFSVIFYYTLIFQSNSSFRLSYFLLSFIHFPSLFPSILLFLFFNPCFMRSFFYCFVPIVLHFFSPIFLILNLEQKGILFWVVFKNRIFIFCDIKINVS